MKVVLNLEAMQQRLRALSAVAPLCRSVEEQDCVGTLCVWLEHLVNLLKKHETVEVTRIDP